MDAAVKAALESDKTVDITTTGRRSGRSVRIETWYLQIAWQVLFKRVPRQAGLAGESHCQFRR